MPTRKLILKIEPWSTYLWWYFFLEPRLLEPAVNCGLINAVNFRRTLPIVIYAFQGINSAVIN
jgi:hypothetical protein